MGAAKLAQASKICLADRPSVNRHFDFDGAGRKLDDRNADPSRRDAASSRRLRGIDGGADRVLQVPHVDHGAARIPPDT